MQQKSGYVFYNYTGTLIKFCISDDGLNEEMEQPLHRQIGIKKDFKEELNKVIEMPGNIVNLNVQENGVFRDH